MKNEELYNRVDQAHFEHAIYNQGMSEDEYDDHSDIFGGVFVPQTDAQTKFFVQEGLHRQKLMQQAIFKNIALSVFTQAMSKPRPKNRNKRGRCIVKKWAPTWAKFWEYLNYAGGVELHTIISRELFALVQKKVESVYKQRKMYQRS